MPSLVTYTFVCVVAGLHVRSGAEDLRMTAETNPMPPPGVETAYVKSYDSEYARMEAWLDEHPDFVHDYFLRYTSELVLELSVDKKQSEKK